MGIGLEGPVDWESLPRIGDTDRSDLSMAFSGTLATIFPSPPRPEERRSPSRPRETERSSVKTPWVETAVAMELAKDWLSKSLAGRSVSRPRLSARLILAPMEEIWSVKEGRLS